MLAGLSLIVQTKRLAGNLMLLGFASIIIANLDPSIVEGIPFYVWFGVGVLLAFSLLRYALALFVGRGAADTAVGNLLAALIAFLVVVVFMPLRLLRRLFPNSD